MTKKEVLKEIKREERRIKTIKENIESAKFDLKATRKTLAFWKRVLKDAD